jgi:hypothetical protein
MVCGTHSCPHEEPPQSSCLDPECTVEFMAPPTQYRAELLTGDARASTWARATDFYAGYERYRASCAPREIRLFRLRPVAA